jgi:hypothetical protein
VTLDIFLSVLIINFREKWKKKKKRICVKYYMGRSRVDDTQVERDARHHLMLNEARSFKKKRDEWGEE